MHKAKFWTPLHLIPLYLAATAVLFGQAAPQLNTKTDGTRILGIYVPGAPGYTLDLRVYLNSHQIQPKELLHSHTGIDFAMDLESPLVAGDSLYVVEVMPDGSKLTSNTIGIPPAPTPPDPIQLAVNSVDAVYGDTKPTVNFAPSNPALDGGTIKLVNGSQATTHTLTADELKNGSAVITLAQPLVHPESGDAIKITFDGSIKAGTKVKADADHAFGAVYARIHTHGPLREGDKEVTGSGGKTVTKVMGIVLEGSYSGPSRKTADSGTARSQTSSAATQTIPVQSKQVQPDQNPSRATQFRGLLEKKYVDYAADDPAVDRDLAADWLRETEETSETATEGGAYDLKLQRPLMAGQRVYVCQVFTGLSAGDLLSYESCERTIVQSSTLDWGRARGIFSLGSVISQKDSFGKVDPYIGAHFEVTIANGLVEKNQGAGKKKTDGDKANMFLNKPFGWSILGFTDVRLSQAASNASAAASTPAAAGTATPAAPASPSGALSPASAAYFSTGLYYAMRFSGMDWVYRGTQYSAFFGPLIKGGVTRVQGGVVLSQVQTKDPLTGAVTSTSKSDTGPAPYFGYGFRAGMMRYDLMGSLANRQVAPDPQIYLDFTWGKDALYRRPRDIVAANTTTTVYDTGRVLALEGRVKIPYLPVETGVDIIFFRHQPQLAGSEYRFILSTRIDAAKALGKFLGN